MHPLDWMILVGFTAWIVYDGLKRTKDSHEIEGYFLAKRSIPWWAAGISVMATQLSAITMIGTTGQGYTDGLRFIQFYFALPLAMIVLSVTLVPFFYNSGVYTAYEYLERRFDAKTRALTSLLFQISRAMSCGAVISAPAVVLSLVLGWDVTATALAIAVGATSLPPSPVPFTPYSVKGDGVCTCSTMISGTSCKLGIRYSRSDASVSMAITRTPSGPTVGSKPTRRRSNAAARSPLASISQASVRLPCAAPSRARPTRARRTRSRPPTLAFMGFRGWGLR